MLLVEEKQIQLCEIKNVYGVGVMVVYTIDLIRVTSLETQAQITAIRLREVNTYTTI